MRVYGVLMGATLLFAGPAAAQQDDAKLAQAIKGEHRTPALVKRDAVRKPYEVLRFLGIQPNQTVVEISPGRVGYWTEILAPYLAGSGQYYAAQYSPKAYDPGHRDYYRDYRKKLDAQPAVYGKVNVSEFGNGFYNIAPPGSADLVLTFRNVHNWMEDGYVDEAFQAFFKALKPGGILGVEEHRGRTDIPQDPKAKSGYVREDYAIELARKAGFEFVGSSELLANPRDTKDYPAGVWTLPPTFRLGDYQRAQYEAIGESDGFLLKFRKP
ncbi:MAG: methyltransferase [Pigmentiphaga sp.]|nr:methyltransferase [Pigmentiphaga sp.]